MTFVNITGGNVPAIVKANTQKPNILYINSQLNLNESMIEWSQGQSKQGVTANQSSFREDKVN